MPDLPTKISSKLTKFANSSIDISDGLFGDLTKLTNTSKLCFRLDVEKIPISSNLKTYLINTFTPQEKITTHMTECPL